MTLKLAPWWLFALATLVWIGCEGPDSSPRIRLSHFQLNLDPSTLSDVESRTVASLIHGGLVAVDSEGNVLPRLAERWQQIDSTTWEFNLRTGAKFTDGSKVDAESVVRSLCWAMQPTHLYSWGLDSIEHKTTNGKDVECTGLSTMGASVVRIREHRSVPWLLQALDSPAGWIVGNPGSQPGPWGVRPGVGPYQIEAVETDESVRLSRRAGGTVEAGSASIIFRHLSDPLVAAKTFVQGQIDLMRVDTPQTMGFMQQRNVHLSRHKFGRVRVVLVSRRALTSKGMSDQQIETFISAYGQATDRTRIAELTKGLAQPMQTAFPPAAFLDSYTPRAKGRDARALPSIALTVLTANDSFSDLIAAYLPERVGNVTLDYRAVEPSLLLNRFLEGDADLVSMLIEPTLDAPVFWSAFWTPGSSFVAFGTPIPQFENLTFVDQSDIKVAATAVDQKGNWIGVLRENGYLAVSNRLRGLRLTPAGQLSLEQLGVGE